MHVETLKCVVVLSICVAADSSDHERNVSVYKKDYYPWTRAEYEMRPNEMAFVARLRGLESEAFPLGGVEFSHEAAELETRFIVDVTAPEKNDRGRWRTGLGSLDRERAYRTRGSYVATEAGEAATPIRSVRLPTKIEGVECYYIPYRVVDSRMDAVLVVIASDKEKIKEAVKLAPSKEFDWDKPFEPAYISKSARRGD